MRTYGGGDATNERHVVMGVGSALDMRLIAPLAVATGVFLAIAAWRWASQRTSTARDVTREQRARLRDQVAIRDSLEALLARLGEAAREADERFERQSARLAELIDAADERIARLAGERAGHAAPAAPVPAAPSSERANADALAGPLDRAGLRETLERIKLRLRSRPAAGAALVAARSAGPGLPAAAEGSQSAPDGRLADEGAGPDAGEATERPDARPVLLDDPRFRPVYDLADAGRSPVQIGEALELLPGEVELILNLRTLA